MEIYNLKASSKINNNKSPWWLMWGVLAICLLPFVTNLFGTDFVSSSENGNLHHALLEWSAFIVAILTAILAFAHFKIKHDVTTLVIGLALLASGFMDAFHTLAATQLIEAVADNSQLIPFTWAASRTFNAIILIVGIGLDRKSVV